MTESKDREERDVGVIALWTVEVRGFGFSNGYGVVFGNSYGHDGYGGYGHGVGRDEYGDGYPDGSGKGRNTRWHQR